MGIKLQGGDDSINNVNVSSRNELAVLTPQTSAGICGGFVQMSTEVDAGDATNSRFVLATECSDDYRLRVGIDQTLFNTTFEGTAILTTQWNSATSVTSNAQANGFLVLNSGSLTSAGAWGSVRSWRLFPMYGTYPLYLDMWIREGSFNATNVISEFGYLLLSAGGTQQPADGIYFRRLSGGELKGIITANNVDLYELTLDTENVPSRSNKNKKYDPAECNHYLIVFNNDRIDFWINDVLVGQILGQSQIPQFSGASNLPVGFRVLNLATASTSAPRQIGVGYVNVGYGDQNVNKPWSHVQSGMGGAAYQLQQGSTPGPTVTRAAPGQGHPASGTARIAGTWTATSAPALNNLGGLWTSQAISTLASDADYPVFAFQNPTGTAAIPGKTLYITGVRIGETTVTVAASTTAFFLSYIVMVEASSSTTSTSDSATTVSGKSMVIGGQGFGADGIGVMKEGFDMTFSSPLVVPAGRFISLIARPFGTVATNSAVLRGSVSFHGYWE